MYPDFFLAGQPVPVPVDNIIREYGLSLQKSHDDPEFEVRLEIEAAIQRIKDGGEGSVPAQVLRSSLRGSCRVGCAHSLHLHDHCRCLDEALRNGDLTHILGVQHLRKSWQR